MVHWSPRSISPSISPSICLLVRLSELRWNALASRPELRLTDWPGFTSLQGNNIVALRHVIQLFHNIIQGHTWCLIKFNVVVLENLQQSFLQQPLDLNIWRWGWLDLSAVNATWIQTATLIYLSFHYSHFAWGLSKRGKQHLFWFTDTSLVCIWVVSRAFQILCLLKTMNLHEINGSKLCKSVPFNPFFEITMRSGNINLRYNLKHKRKTHGSPFLDIFWKKKKKQTDIMRSYLKIKINKYS